VPRRARVFVDSSSFVADASNGRLLSAHILAPEGADSIQTAMAIGQGLTVDNLADTIFPYLTRSKA
jgi:mercuric reductase